MELTRAKFGIIIPTHSHFDYAERAICSAFANTPDPVVLIVDDASPDACRVIDGCPSRGVIPERLLPLFDEPAFKDRLFWVGYLKHGGLTRSWNGGLHLLNNIAEESRPEYAVCTNSDVVFTPGWTDAVTYQLEHGGYDLVGPLSNAPGTTAKGGVQEIQHYLKDYIASDEDIHLRMVARTLTDPRHYFYEAVATPVNGFCMVARLATWWANAYDADNVFRPVNEVNSKGQKNPTPLMTLNEDEFQARLHAKGGKSGVALGSFVFHYRAVSRGDRHKHGLWYRLDGSHACQPPHRPLT